MNIKKKKEIHTMTTLILFHSFELKDKAGEDKGVNKYAL